MSELARLPDRRLRLAFFGTPELAKTILEALLDADRDDVVIAVCQPDKPKGRGKRLEAPPVKQLAAARGLLVAQPAKMKDGAVAAELRRLELDLAIVAAFGRILPEEVLASTRAGFWNVHASLLPRHRGASPIQHAILCGDAKSGVDLMRITPGMDEGPVLLERAIELAADETTPTLTAKLALLGAELVLDGLGRAKQEGLQIREQDHAKATYAPIIEKQDGLLDFSRPAAELDRRIRALNPWPGTFVPLEDGQPLRILRARPIATRTSELPAAVLEAGPRLTVQTGEGALEILELQPPGKRPMPAADYLHGAGRALVIGKRFPR